MKACRIIRVLTLAATLMSGLVWAAESDRRFLRSEGSMSLGDASVRTVISASKGTNAFPWVEVTWRDGEVTDFASQPMKQMGWFVFAEQPTRIWVFDGDRLSLMVKNDKTKSVSVEHVRISSFSKLFRSCPREVREALPERVRKK